MGRAWQFRLSASPCLAKRFPPGNPAYICHPFKEYGYMAGIGKSRERGKLLGMIVGGALALAERIQAVHEAGFLSARIAVG